jgi:acyl carrier protein
MTNDQTGSPKAEILERTRAYLRENFLYMRPDWTLGEDDPLLGTGVIDSIGVIEVVEFLQREFTCVIAEEEITEANLGSLGAIVRFVRAKCNGDGTGRPHQAA